MWNALREAHSQCVYENAISPAAWCPLDFQLQFYKIDSVEGKTPCRTVPDPIDSPSDIAVPPQYKDEDGH